MEKEMNRKGDYSLKKLDRLSPTKHNKILIRDLSDETNDHKHSSFVFIENNTVVVSFLSVLFVPYILGMLLTLILFYFYVGISVTDFFHVYNGLSQIVFWILGAYCIITVADIWLLSRKFFGRG